MKDKIFFNKKIVLIFKATLLIITHNYYIHLIHGFFLL